MGLRIGQLIGQVQELRWQELLDDGVNATISAIADKERINRSYLSRVIGLSLLAPDIVDAILDGTQPSTLRFAEDQVVCGPPSPQGSMRVVNCAPSSATKIAINSAISVLLALAETRCIAPGGSKND
jgi:hypothetical protein